MYTAHYISTGSWNDAEAYCKTIGSHLWSINSYFEWWNLHTSFSAGVLIQGQGRDMNINFHYLASTVLLFIGLHQQNENIRKVTQLSQTL